MLYAGIKRYGLRDSYRTLRCVPTKTPRLVLSRIIILRDIILATQENINTVYVDPQRASEVLHQTIEGMGIPVSVCH